MADRPDFNRLGDLLPAGNEGALGASGPGEAREGSSGAGPSRQTPMSGAADDRAADLNRLLAAVWADVVGAEVAGNAKPVQLREGRLVVTTSSSAWAQTLQLMSEMVIARLNERLGEAAVKKAVFRHAGWEDFSPVAAGPPAAGRSPRGRGGRDVHAPTPREADQPEGASLTGATPPSAPPGAVAGDDPAGFSDEEKQALADLELLPLLPSVKETIRDAMKAGFVRARQDSGRS